MKPKLRVLVVEDVADDADLTMNALGSTYDVTSERVESGPAMSSALERAHWDIILSDDVLPGFSAQGALLIANDLAPGVPFLIVSGEILPEAMVELMRRGACDFVPKGLLDRLGPAIERELRSVEGRRESFAMQLSLDDSELRFKTVIDTAQDPYVACDTIGVCLATNPATERVFGWTAEELIGRPLRETILPEATIVATARAHGIVQDLAFEEDGVQGPLNAANEEVATNRDGHVIPVEVTRWATVQGDVTVINAFFRDISGRKAVEDELARTADALRSSDEQRRMLIGHLVVAQERERAEIANDIHDDSLQAITAAAMRLEMVRDDTDDPKKQAALVKAVDTVRAAASRLRHLLFELRPPALDRVGLTAALREQLDRLADETNVRFELKSELGREPSIPVRVTLFRIAQEALANVRKHSHAAEAVVTIGARDGGTFLTVTDNGVGLPQAAAEDAGLHWGVGSMRERARQVGGWCDVTSEPGTGTTVEAWVPHVHEESAA